MLSVPVILWVLACTPQNACNYIKIDELKAHECQMRSQQLLPQWQQYHPQYTHFKKIGCSRIGHEPIELRSDPA